jgi:hypothetical protein
VDDETVVTYGSYWSLTINTLIALGADAEEL